MYLLTKTAILVAYASHQIKRSKVPRCKKGHAIDIKSHEAS